MAIFPIYGYPIKLHVLLCNTFLLVYCRVYPHLLFHMLYKSSLIHLNMQITDDILLYYNTDIYIAGMGATT